MSQYPVHLLNSLVAFGESKTIAEAALRLGLTQPALSKQLQALEALMARPLFAYRGRNKVLTPFGQELHRSLKERLGHLDELVHLTENLHADRGRARVRVVARRGILDRMSAHIHFPGFLEFIEASNAEVIEALQTRRAELGIAHDAPDTHELVAKPLFRERFCVAVPRSFAVAHRSFGRRFFLDLVKRPCLGFKANDELLNRVCALHDIAPTELRMARVTSDYSSLARMVEAGLGWAILPTYLARESKQVQAVSLPPDAIVSREFHLLYRPEYSSVPWFKELRSEVMACFKPGQ
jgi:DNA-binding transcriptional LysR family regulator